MKTEFVELMFRALNGDAAGLKIRSNDPATLRQKLYEVRRSFPELAELSIISSPTDTDNELWIMKNGKGNREENP